jgi:hypothetical protein
MVMLDPACLSTPPRPTCRAFKVRGESYTVPWSAATGCEQRRAPQRGGVRTLKGTGTRRSNARVQRGRERHSELMRNLLHGLRCNTLLDSASFRTPLRPTAAPSTIVTNGTRYFLARQLTAMCRQPRKRGGAVHCEDRARRCLTPAFSGSPP